MKRKPSLGFEITPTKCVIYSRFDPANKEWGPLIKKPWGNKSFWASPMSAGLNYGLAVFEGMKAFRHKSGEIFLFRPRNHAKRFNRSLEGLLMPAFPPEKFMEAVQSLVMANAKFIPEYRQGSLYIRPIAYGNDMLGFSFKPKLVFTCAFWCTPVGNYYPEGLKPIGLYVIRNMVRAMPGGVGYCKASGNYEISRKAQSVAKEKGCQDALFLDGETKSHIEELGGANIFIVKNDIVYTPLLGDTILDGVTRDSIKILAISRLKLTVCVRDITVEQLINADEVFACGTAASITPVNSIKDRGDVHNIGSGEPGEITKKLYELLTGIQCGDIEDEFQWLTEVL